jgi:uncharacterized phage protein (TIGR02218 family)
MKSLNPALAAHLASGTTTLCWCWKIARCDGVMLGFTDHDAPVTFDGLTYEADSGFTPSEVQSHLDLSVDNLSVTGALSSASLNEDDLAAGRFDGAALELWRVNWAAPEQRALMRKATLGEVKRGRTAFAAEVRGLTAALNRPVGRVFGHSCDAMLGDARCTVTPATIAVTIAAVRNPRIFTVTGAQSYDTDCFAYGIAAFTSGACKGASSEIKRHTMAGGITTIELWLAPSESLLPGDALTLTQGCDKEFSTCKNKFSNAVNFRGCPYMPGTAITLASAAASTPLDGKSRYGN